ncbi:MAG: S9 family peptidase [Proteobacteria bacterium]|nr:S9 family peptidase [Pseudomonadota bacterium]
MPQSRLLCAAVTTLLLVFATAAAAQDSKRAITHEDLWLMKRVGAPQPSPDGRWLVVPVTDPAYDQSKVMSDLWLIATDGRTPARRLTSTRRGEAGVVWSDDSKRIAFSTQRDGDDAPQIYLLDLSAGGEAQRLTSMVTGATDPVFAPDGRRLAFQSLVYPGATSREDNERLHKERAERKWNARIYDGFPIRNWDKWRDDRRARLFILALNADGTPQGLAINLFATSSLAAAPGFAGRNTNDGEAFDVVFTPDGQSLVFVATNNQDAAAYEFVRTALYRQDLAGGEPRLLTPGEDSFETPRFSPDGRTLFARREPRTDKVYNSMRLVASPWGTALAFRPVSAALDRSVDSYAIAPDSRRVFFTADDAGNQKLYAVAASGGAVRELFAVGNGSLHDIAIPERAQRLALYGNWESAAVPAEVVAINPAAGSVVPLTQFNRERVAALDLPPVEHFWFESAQGRRVHSLVVRPAGFDPSKKNPLLVLIHGGPHSSWSDQWVLRWNYHLLAAPGYVLLLTNYTGSVGFGEQFAQSIQGDPLKTPGDEINQAADEAIKRFAFIDSSRQCAGGASYGGHLSNWLQGTTTRYRCLLSHAGLVNLEAQWGTSDVTYPREVNNGGPPWEQGAVWREQNPIRLAAKWRTPVLLTVGEQDFRVPLNNTLEYWSALQRMQVPSRLVVFPDENHWILSGENSRLFYNEIDTWLAKWLAPQALPSRAN